MIDFFCLLDEFLKKRYGFKVELIRKLQAHVAKGAARVLAPSQYLKGVAEKWDVRPEKISVIYNKIEAPKVSVSKEEARRKLGAKEDEIILFSFGRDVPWKGFEMLRKLVYLPRQERDLDVRRAGVSIVPGGIFHYRHLFLRGKHESPHPTTSCDFLQVLRGLRHRG